MAMGRRKAAAGSVVHYGDGVAQVGGASVLPRSSINCWPRPSSTAGSNGAASSTTTRRKSGASRAFRPGLYFRMLLVGYFENIDSQRGIAWRCADSLSLAGVPGRSPGRDDARSFDADQHPQAAAAGSVRGGVSIRAVDRGGRRSCIPGKTVGVDSTTLEANAAMKSIVRRDTGEDWKEYVTRLMKEEGVIEQRARADRRRGPPLRQSSGRTRRSATRNGCRRPIRRAGSRR